MAGYIKFSNTMLPLINPNPPTMDIEITNKQYVDDEISYMNSYNTKENLIVNGRLDIWQNIKVADTNDTVAFELVMSRYFADMIKCSVNGEPGTTIGGNFQRKTFTIAESEPTDEKLKYYLQTNITSLGTWNTDVYVKHSIFIEGLRKMSGQTITFSFYAWADAPKNMAVSFTQKWGDTQVSPTTDTFLETHTINLTTTKTKYVISVNCPSVIGREADIVENNSAIIIDLWYYAGSTYNVQTNSLGKQTGTFNIAGLKCELGLSETMLEKEDVIRDLAKCQRYFEKSYNYEVPVGTIGLNSGHLYINVSNGTPQSSVIFKSTKRVNPTIKPYATLDGVVNKATLSGADVSFQATAFNTNVTSFMESAPNQSGTYTFHYTIDANF